MQRERKEAKVPCSKTKAPAEAGTFQISRCIPHRRKSGSFAVRLDVDLENQRREGRNVGIDLGRGYGLARIVIAAVAPVITAVIAVVAQTAVAVVIVVIDRKSTRLNSSHSDRSRMPSSA